MLSLLILFPFPMDEYLGDLCTSYLDDYDDLFSQQDLTQRQSTSALLNHHVDSQHVLDDSFETFSSQLLVPTISNSNDTTTSTTMIATKRPAIIDDSHSSTATTATGTQPQSR